jgi:hypothetical protein
MGSLCANNAPQLPPCTSPEFFPHGPSSRAIRVFIRSTPRHSIMADAGRAGRRALYGIGWEPVQALHHKIFMHCGVGEAAR